MFPFFGLLEGVDNSLYLPASISRTDFVVAPDTATVEVRVNSNGDVEWRAGGVGGWTVNGSNQWMNDEFAALPAFDASLYECGYFSVTGTGTGDLSGPTLDAYHACSTTRTWTLSRFFSGFGSRQVTGTLKIREIANPVNEMTCSVTLRLDSEL